MRIWLWALATMLASCSTGSGVAAAFPPERPPAQAPTAGGAPEADSLHTPVTRLQVKTDDGQSLELRLFFADAAAARQAFQSATCVSGFWARTAMEGGLVEAEAHWNLALQYPEFNDSDTRPYVLAPVRARKSARLQNLPDAERAELDAILAGSGHLLLRATDAPQEYEIIGYSASSETLLRFFGGAPDLQKTAGE